VNPPLRFGHRDALHAVHAALVLEMPVRLTATYRNDDFLISARVVLARRDDLGTHSVAFGVSQIHPQEICCEDAGFVAAGAGTNFDEDVFRVVRVGGNH